MSEMKERLQHDLSESGVFNAVLQSGQNITGKISSLEEDGLYVEEYHIRFIPYSQISSYILTNEKGKNTLKTAKIVSKENTTKVIDEESHKFTIRPTTKDAVSIENLDLPAIRSWEEVVDRFNIYNKDLAITCRPQLEEVTMFLENDKSAQSYEKLFPIFNKLKDIIENQESTDSALELLARVALISESVKIAKKALVVIYSLWKPVYLNNIPLILELGKVSSQAEDYSFLYNVVKQADSENQKVLIPALVYILRQAGDLIEETTEFSFLMERFKKLSAASTSAKVIPSTKDSMPTDDMKESQNCRGVVEFIQPNGFGIIADYEGEKYFFLMNENVAETNRARIAPGQCVNFTSTQVYSMKENGYVLSADNVHLEELARFAPVVSGEGGVYATITTVNPGENAVFSLSAFQKVNPIRGETLAVYHKDGTMLGGEYISHTQYKIKLQNGKTFLDVPISTIKQVYFCGLITSYDILNSSGMVNNQYRFRRDAVASEVLERRIFRGNQKEKNMYICLYSLGLDSGQLYVTSIDDFEDVLMQMEWQHGTVTDSNGEARYFTVEEKARCYYSVVEKEDETIPQLINENNLLQQNVFYKRVRHRVCDERRRTDELSVSIVAVRSEIQSARVERNPETNSITMNCGVHSYPYTGVEVPQNDEITIAISCTEKNKEEAVAVIAETPCQLPDKKAKVDKMRKELEEYFEEAWVKRDFRQQKDAKLQMLERHLRPVDELFREIMMVATENNAPDFMEALLKEKGYQLSVATATELQMMTALLKGDIEHAKKHAQTILLIPDSRPSVLLNAYKILKRGSELLVRENLFSMFFEESNPDAIVKTGAIDSFDKNMRIGQIICDIIQVKDPRQRRAETLDLGLTTKGKARKYLLKFSANDIIEWEGECKEFASSGFDFKKYIYIVQFNEELIDTALNMEDVKAPKVDKIPVVGRACEIRIVGVVNRSTFREVENIYNKENLLDERFDRELDSITNLPPSPFLLFRLQQYELKNIMPYLASQERERVTADGIYVGTEEQTEHIVRAMDDYYEKNKKDEEVFIQDVPEDTKQDLFLAQAKIISQYIRKYGFTSNIYLQENEVYKQLYQYAYDSIVMRHDMKEGEISYYGDSVLNDALLGISKESRIQIVAWCVSRYFENREQIINLHEKGMPEGKEREDVLRSRLIDCEGFVSMIFNFPNYVFEKFLDYLDEDKTKENLTKIAEFLLKGKIHTDAEPKLVVLKIHDAYTAAKTRFAGRLQTTTKDVRRSAQEYVELYKDEEDGFVKYLFDEEKTLLRNICNLMERIANFTDDEKPEEQNQYLESFYRECAGLIKEIEINPTKLGFEVLRQFLKIIQDSIVKYLEKIYRNHMPKLQAVHYMLADDKEREIVELTNDKLSTTAYGLQIYAEPYEESKDFVVDTGTRSIKCDSKIGPGEAIEVSIPIHIMDATVNHIEMQLIVSYERYTKFDSGKGTYVIERVEKPFKESILIPIVHKDKELMRYEDNRYRMFAGGMVMDPNNGQSNIDMFFGREDFLNKVFLGLLNVNGELNLGTMVGLYGQKRCGKTSVTNFLSEKIKKEFPDALVLMVNAQDCTIDEKANKSLFFQLLLSGICTSMRNLLRKKRYSELAKELKNNDLKVPEPNQIIGQNAASEVFKSFFGQFRALYEKKYPIVVMIDEFTQVYIHLKNKCINEDFLNSWRAIVQVNQFINVLIGQDFMPQFFSDPEIQALNGGGAVNGLGTVAMYELTYLDRKSAEKMIVEPTCYSDKSSRFKGKLGKSAIDRIYELTGGSAFYLMKFMNSLVDYMIEKKVDSVTTGLVDEVANGFVFENRNNPIDKKDFDPIYNEYSASYIIRRSLEIGQADKEYQDSVKIKEVWTEHTYKLMKEVARVSNIDGICHIDDIKWPDIHERNEIIRALRGRHILVDSHGQEITGDIENIEFKFKVGLFTIWLKKRELNL